MRSLPVITEALMSAAARLSSARVFATWRPLLWFWLSILSVAAAGGAVLHYLGPLPAIPARYEVRSGPQHSPGPVEPEPLAMASVSPLVPPPILPVSNQPDPAEPSPPRPQPAPVAQAPSITDQGATQPHRQVLITLHPARSDGSRAIAQQLAAQLGFASDQIATGAPGDPVPRAIIRFYSTGDHPLARRLGNELAQMGYAWQIENLAERPSASGDRPLEIWLPRR